MKGNAHLSRDPVCLHHNVIQHCVQRGRSLQAPSPELSPPLDHSCDAASSLLPTEMHCTMQPQPQPSQRQQVETIVKSLCAFQDREKKNQMPETLTHSAHTTLMIHKGMNIVHGMICNMLIHGVHCFVQSRQFLKIWLACPTKVGWYQPDTSRDGSVIRVARYTITVKT